MGTLNPADYFGIRDAGAVAPGRKANLVVFSDLADIRAEQVFFMGRQVAENGRLLSDVQRPAPVAVPPAMRLDPGSLDFAILRPKAAHAGHPGHRRPGDHPLRGNGRVGQ
jgi:adenine deaminase